MADRNSTGPRVAECRSCKAPMYWVITADGKKMPVDEKPDPTGGFVLTLKANGELHAEAVMPHHGGDRRRFTSHFATCPNAAQHRRPRDG